MAAAQTSPAPQRFWRIPAADPARVETLAAALHVTLPFARLLHSRGFLAPDAARRYLRPEFRDLHDPHLMADMEAAVARIRRALSERQRILVFGDYDVDGITGTSLLQRFFTLAGHPVAAFIPDRLTEGYGLNEASAERIAAAGDVDLVLTVDCGVSDRAGVALLKARGIDVVVTDHHVAPPELPPADALVNPMRADCPYPFKRLAGVGVAFKLAVALAEAFSPRRRASDEFKDFLLEATGLVALGTVCDVVPLVGENRVLVAHGLRSLAASPTPGIRALLEAAGVAGQPLEPVHLAFKVGPRINAAGRMGCPEDALALLAASSYPQAVERAARLDALNTRRQNQERSVLRQVERILEKETAGLETGIVLARSGWSPGILGIVASRLADAHRVPAVLIALQGEHARGSGRSVPGLNLLEVLARCQADLITCGGHAGAVGFTLRTDRAESFVAALGKALAERWAAGGAGSELTADAELNLSELTPALLRELEDLRPHGEGNPPALFVARGVEVPGRARAEGPRRRQLRFLVRQGADRPPVSAVALGLGLEPGELKALAPLDIAYVPRLVFHGGHRGTLEISVRAAAPSKRRAPDPG
ncbi:MAG: single-stranded-DNA-specific exonuclease RecJ [Planctomycetes bacterium]|nr:single-stranded-DNA-specific exonuclease RecJ [Planctomycetota bacterium]